MTRSEAVARLRAAGVEDPLRDVRRLEQAAEGRDQWFADAVARRAAREPMSHILGYRDFWEHRFRVTRDVLDPRPETETLVSIALREPFNQVLDLGTGSGAILISLLAACPEATGVGTDVSEQAILLAGANAQAIGVADRLILPLSDWWEDVGGVYDLIVSNPPYIAAAEIPGLSEEVRAYEPRGSLTDEADGLTAYRAIAAGAEAHLADTGRLLVEIGPTQAAGVAEIFRAAGLDVVAVHPDLDGRDRVIEARRLATVR